MYTAAEPSPWQGRIDAEDGPAGYRWHQIVQLEVGEASGIALLGLCSDLGVTLNKGRSGAAQGPRALRQALANSAWHHDQPLYDGGDIQVIDDLAAGQALYADHLASLLQQQHFVIGLGGGHEIGWAGYLGCQQYLQQHARSKTLGILNFDAHFDLRQPAPVPSSGTPFYQVARHCAETGQAFNYACLGIATTANTRALFQRAQELSVPYVLDIHCDVPTATEMLRSFLGRVDYLYLTFCMDVLPAAYAPGVSAPASCGLEPRVALQLLALVGELCREQRVNWLLADVAELAPPLDLDGRTARLAARIIDQIAGAHRHCAASTSQSQCQLQGDA